MTSQATEDRTVTALTGGRGRGLGGQLTASREFAPPVPSGEASCFGELAAEQVGDLAAQRVGVFDGEGQTI